MTTHSIISLTNSTAVSLTAGYDSGFDITIQNLSTTADVFIGGSGVTTSSFGYKITPGNAFSVELSGIDDLFAIASASCDIAVLKLNLEVGK